MVVSMLVVGDEDFRYGVGVLCGWCFNNPFGFVLPTQLPVLLENVVAKIDIARQLQRLVALVVLLLLIASQLILIGRLTARDNISWINLIAKVARRRRNLITGLSLLVPHRWCTISARLRSGSIKFPKRSTLNVIVVHSWLDSDEPTFDYQRCHLLLHKPEFH